MLERLSVPRRALDFEDYVDMLRRNFRWLLAPAFAGLVICTVVAYMMEDSFVSQALIRIVPQQISDTLVQNVSAQQLADSINSMAESILSRATLTNLINSYHLYPQEMKSEPLEDVINEMHSAISIRPITGIANVSGRATPAMQVSFRYRERFTAQKVCEEIVSRFLSQNNQASLESHEATGQFFDDEIQRAKRELDVVEQKLADFRTRNAGRLPEEMQMNVQQMNALSQHASMLGEALNHNSEQHMLLENQLRTAKDRLAIVKEATPQAQAHNQRLTDFDKQIEQLKLSIDDMKDHYTEDYPDLQRARQQLALLEKERDQAAKDKPVKGDNAAADNPVVAGQHLDAQSQIDTIQTQLKALDLDRQQYTKELDSVNAELRNFQSRLSGIPAGEKEYTDLINDRDLARAHYTELAQKQSKAALSVDVERRKQGESLEVIDAASLPTSPTAPKRPMIIPIGPAAGLILGLVLVAIREVKDTSLKNLKDARLYTNLNILGSIPLLENDLIVQRRKQIMWVGWAAATLVGLAIMAGSVAHYYMSKA